MHKGLNSKIASILITTLLLAPTVLPLQVRAGVEPYTGASTPSGQTSTPLNYDNPNSGSNPFKPKVKDLINPKLLSQVVGCTGIVNTVSKTIVDAVKKQAKKLLDKTKKRLADKAKKQLTKTTKNIVATTITGIIQTALGATTTTAVGTGTQLGTGAGKGIENLSNRNVTEEHAEVPGVEEAVEHSEENQAARHEEDKQDDKKDKYFERCMNGIAIQLAKNQLSAMTKYSMNWVNTGLSGNPFYVQNVQKYMGDIEDSILKQETKLFKDPTNANDYLYGRDFTRDAIVVDQSEKNFAASMKQNLTNYLAPGATPQSFATNFAEGGWKAWWALTQNDQNNPFGFAVRATEHLKNEQQKQVENAKAEINRSGGYVDQKECAKQDGTSGECIETKTVTPGSNIAAKVNTYINSPERQTELVKTMNDALNALFTALLSKFENQGLSGLAPSANISTPVAGGGITPSITFDEDGYVNVDDTEFGTGTTPIKTTTGVMTASEWIATHGGTTPIAGTNGIYTGNNNTHQYIQDDGFDITKDLGNTYDADGVLIKKGVIQNQYDYVDAMGIYKSVIADVLPALGELDYCIPGPNPNWRENSKAAIDEYLSTLSGIEDASNIGNTIVYAPEGTYEYPRPLPQDPPKKRVSLLKRISFIVNPIAGMHQIRKKFQDAAQRRKNETERAAIEADNERIRAQNEKIRNDMLAGKRPLDPIFIANTIGTDRDSILKMIAPENTGLDPSKLLATLDAFEEYIDGNYGLSSPMQNYWKGNTKYLQMSQEGLNLTKDIPSYIDEVEAAKNDSRDLLAEATPNLDKLKAIQKRVNEIIAAAQARRAAKMNTDGSPKISPTCLLKEKVTFTDYNGKIISSTDDRPLPVIKTRAQVIKDYAPPIVNE